MAVSGLKLYRQVGNKNSESNVQYVAMGQGRHAVC